MNARVKRKMEGWKGREEVGGKRECEWRKKGRKKRQKGGMRGWR